MPLYKLGETVKDLCHEEEKVVIREIELHLNGDGIGYLIEYEDGHEAWVRESDLSF